MINYEEKVYLQFQLITNLKTIKKFLWSTSNFFYEVSKKTSFELGKTHFAIPLIFVGVADFEPMKKQDNTMKGKLAKEILYEQVPISVTLYKRNKLGNPCCLKSFGKECV